jgi:hypothetical protein
MGKITNFIKKKRARKTATRKRYEQAQKELASAEKLINQLESEGFKVASHTKYWVEHYKGIKRYTDDSFKQMKHYTNERNIRRFATKTFNYVHTDKQFDKEGKVILDEHNNAKTFSYNLKLNVTAYKTDDQVARQVYKYVQKIINTNEKTLGIRTKQQKAVRDLLMSMQDFGQASGKNIRLYEGREGHDIKDDVEKMKKQTEKLNWKNFKELYKTMESMGQWENQADYFLDRSLMHEGRRKAERTRQHNKMRNTLLSNLNKDREDVDKLTDEDLDALLDFFENSPTWAEWRKNVRASYDLTELINSSMVVNEDNTKKLNLKKLLANYGEDNQLSTLVKESMNK